MHDLVRWVFSQRRPPARRGARLGATSMSAMRCPGAPALLVGDARERGATASKARAFATTLATDEGFLAAAQAQGAPSVRLQFAPVCVENDCAHWGVAGCELLGRIAQLLVEAGAPVKPSPAYDCTIRHDCRWRRQGGDEACGICGFVVREPLDPCSRHAGAGRQPAL